MNFQPIKLPLMNRILALALILFGLAVAAAGIYVGEIDDAPGAALVSLVVMLGTFVGALKLARRKRHLDGQLGQAR